MHIDSSPILISEHNLVTNDWTFKNCMNSVEGGVFEITSQSTYKDTNSVFKNNIAFDGAAINARTSNISLNGTIFEYNYALRSAGVIYIKDESFLLTFYNVTALGNEAGYSVGVFYCESGSYFSIESSNFTNNTSGDTSVLFTLLCDDDSQIVDSDFYYNNSTIGGTIKTILTNLTIYNTTFEDNASSLQTSSIYVAFSYSNITICNFANTDTNTETNSRTSRLTGGFMFFTADSNVEINNWTFTNGVATSGGALYFAGDWIATINWCNFKNNAVFKFGGSIYSNNNNITVNNSTFYRNLGGLQGSDIYGTFGTISIYESDFEVGKKVSVYTTSVTTKLNQVYMVGSNTSSQEFTSDYGAGVYAEDTEEFVVESSTFENLTFAQFGGAIAIIKTSSLAEGDELPTKTYYTIKDSTFTSNIAQVGGAIYIYDTETVSISNCSFNGNIANYDQTVENSGYGGSIFYYTTGKLNND